MAVHKVQHHPDGPTLSQLAFGIWRLVGVPDARVKPRFFAERIEACLDAGITTFDSADVYGGYEGESVFGAGLEEWAGSRDDIQIVSKCGIALVNRLKPDHRVKHYDSSKDHIVASVDQTLRDLRTDYIDLLLIHRPDLLMNADETAAALSTVCYAGKVRHVGVSNFTPAQFDLLQSRLDRPLVANQIEYSALHVDPLFDGSLDHCQRLRIAPMVWSPLGGGALFDGQDPRTTKVRNAIAMVADQMQGITTAQTALSWVLTHPAKPVVAIGTSRLDRIKAYAAVGHLRLQRQQWYSILEAARGVPVA